MKLRTRPPIELSIFEQHLGAVSVEDMDWWEVSRAPYPFIRKSQAQWFFALTTAKNMLECEKAFLESFGYTVLTAPSGDKGLELASMFSVDVVIVDYFMPEMNGLELTIEMRRLRPQAPIILLSGTTDIPEQALKSGGMNKSGTPGKKKGRTQRLSPAGV